ncbi:MAG: hypothetical protein J07HQW1_01742 [Haloquadratum walsbyi J07HQW1]|uniref:Uncharacterized protein n=1 Tax=Haloquadratum walsbyi J07HQW1 TaxID=1238424 RepID=U1N5J6_9EURY|nr:MAG: hypothetical protein J07HQW1_01742 [Haloquadratum walsbyi J07HQW1]
MMIQRRYCNPLSVVGTIRSEIRELSLRLDTVPRGHSGQSDNYCYDQSGKSVNSADQEYHVLGR